MEEQCKKALRLTSSQDYCEINSDFKMSNTLESETEFVEDFNKILPHFKSIPGTWNNHRALVRIGLSGDQYLVSLTLSRHGFVVCFFS